MERLLQKDESIITFDISDILNKNVNQMEEIEANDIPDEVLKELLDNNEADFNTEVNATERNDNLPIIACKEVPQVNRFRFVTKSDVDDIASKSCKKTTHKQTAWGIKVFREWLVWKGVTTKFEDMTKEVLADTLREFYPSARQTSKDDKEGKPYAKQSLINIRSAINRHLQLQPHNKPWDIMNNKEFLAANRVFKGNLCEQKEKGLDKSRRHPPVMKEHIQQMYDNYFIPHYDNDPVCLQHKVYFDIAFFLGKRGQEGLRQLKKNSFALKNNASGREYLELTYNESTKKSQGDDNNEINEQPILLSQPDNPKCPVKSHKLYVSKLSDIQDFFQTPNPYYRSTGVWYKSTPVGENTIGKFLKKICENSGINTVYTNHCLRGTTATAMHKSGYSFHDIAQVTRHKNLEGLKHYLAQPTIDDMQNYSNSLFDYTNDDKENSDEDFETPPVPTKNMYDKIPKKKAKTESETQVVPFKPHGQGDINTNNNSELQVQVTPQTTTSNVMQLYRQNPVGMFVGANLNNCTININMPK